MFKICWHKWHILESLPDSTIEAIVKNPELGADILSGVGLRFKEKVCLKCGKYVDEITPRYEYHKMKRLKLKQKAAMAEKIVSKMKLPDRPWRNK